MLPIENSVPIPTDSAKSTADDDVLSQPGERKRIAAEIMQDIDAYCVAAYDDGHRKHLGASLIGHECSRYLWNVFRWLKREKFTGRQLRLFQRGHLEEARFEEYLRGIGAEVIAFQPDADGNANKGEQQFRIVGVMGHFGGSLDGQIKLPAKYGVGFGMLSEYKTKGTGRGFTELREKGVKLAAPMHYAQMSMYGRHYGYKYALYMSVNKNDDDMHVEITELDWQLAEQLERKAEDVITSPYPPAKIAQSPAFGKCKMCNFSDICHNGAEVEINCRSCAASSPVDGGQWFCRVYGSNIPLDYVAKGCDKHVPVISG